MTSKISIILTLFFGLLTFCNTESFAYKGEIDGFTIYFRLDEKASKTKVSELRVTYNLYYPFREFVRKKLSLAGVKKGETFSANVECLDLFLNGKRTLIEPGDTVVIGFTSSGEISFPGTDSIYLRFDELSKKQFYSVHGNPMTINVERFKRLEDYKDYCLKYMAAEQSYIDSFFGGKKPLIKKYLLQKAYFDFIWVYSKIFEREVFTLPDSLFISSWADKGIRNDSPGYFDYSYRNALFKYVELIAGESKSPLSSAKLGHILEKGRVILSQKSYKALLLNLFDIISRVSASEYDYLTRTIYKRLCKMEFLIAEKRKIDKMYARVLVASKKLKDFGEIDITTPDEKRRKLKNVLVKKKIYIVDFWASWCVPCVYEFPYIKQLTNKYPDIQVISISIDSDPKKWLASIKKHQLLSSQNYLLANLDRNKLLEAFQITEIPRFMIFNGKGECITSNASRPSERNFHDYLQKLLESQD